MQKSHEWFLKAANLNDPFAQYAVALNYSNGNGVEENFSEYARWIHKAAEQGEVHAQYELGMIYCAGEDKEKAKMWFEKSAVQGYEEAIQKLAELK